MQHSPSNTKENIFQNNFIDSQELVLCNYLPFQSLINSWIYSCFQDNTLAWISSCHIFHAWSVSPLVPELIVLEFSAFGLFSPYLLTSLDSHPVTALSTTDWQVPNFYFLDQSSELKTHISNWLLKIYTWMSYRHFKLNVSKTKHDFPPQHAVPGAFLSQLLATWSFQLFRSKLWNSLWFLSSSPTWYLTIQIFYCSTFKLFTKFNRLTTFHCYASHQPLLPEVYCTTSCFKSSLPLVCSSCGSQGQPFKT